MRRAKSMAVAWADVSVVGGMEMQTFAEGRYPMAVVRTKRRYKTKSRCRLRGVTRTSLVMTLRQLVTRSRHQTMFIPPRCLCRLYNDTRGKPDRIPAEFRIGGQAMECVIAKLLQDFEQGKMNRRQLIQSLSLAAAA